VGTISGVITDRDGAAVPKARASLTREATAAAANPPELTAVSGNDGHFTFANVPSGLFTLTISARGFILLQTSGELHPGEDYQVPRITLPTVSTNIDVQVTASQEEIAQSQIQDEEKQRVLGIIPNFYVSYVPNAAPLTTRQKYQLAWKNIIDPTAFLGAGVAAGIQQANNSFAGYGQGTQGYAKRFAASYGNVLTGTYIGGAILPSLLKQDPRYFYKGVGTVRSRIRYALVYAFLCKGDNGRPQFNYSGILGSLASAGISNAYYPAANRDGAGLTFENLGFGIAGSAASNILQEFLIPHLTRHKPPLPANP
jgi:hypothetical protein